MQLPDFHFLWLYCYDIVTISKNSLPPGPSLVKSRDTTLCVKRRDTAESSNLRLDSLFSSLIFATIACYIYDYSILERIRTVTHPQSY